MDGEPAPDRSDEYRFYQALVGVCPFDPPASGMASRLITDDLVQRLRAYMNKSIKEAKVHTSWINENRAYDDAVSAFVERSLGGGARFVGAGLPFIERVARAGAVNSLAQLVLKLTSPGVPDFYQGTELWDLTLVDPDNRRPVDFDHRVRLLDAIEPLIEQSTQGDPDRVRKVGELLTCWPDARIKMFTTACGLRLRRSDPDLFLRGEYVPLDAAVTVSGGIVAFARTLDERALITIAPRLTASLASDVQPFPVGRKLEDVACAAAAVAGGSHLPQPLHGRGAQADADGHGELVLCRGGAERSAGRDPAGLTIGRLNPTIAPPCGPFSALMRPPCVSMIPRAIESPIPIPSLFVV